MFQLCLKCRIALRWAGDGAGAAWCVVPKVQLVQLAVAACCSPSTHTHTPTGPTLCRYAHTRTLAQSDGEQWANVGQGINTSLLPNQPHTVHVTTMTWLFVKSSCFLWLSDCCVPSSSAMTWSAVKKIHTLQTPTESHVSRFQNVSEGLIKEPSVFVSFNSIWAVHQKGSTNRTQWQLTVLLLIAPKRERERERENLRFTFLLR